MAQITLNGFRCERCAHEWVPRDSTQMPKVCPKCKSPYWDRPTGGYEFFEGAIAMVLRDAGRPLTWSEVREIGRLTQKFPNNKWVRRLEANIGLVRERGKNGSMTWSLLQ